MNELWVSLGALLWSEVRLGPERSSLYIFDMTHLGWGGEKTSPTGSQSTGNEASKTHVALVFQSAQRLWETIGPPF